MREKNAARNFGTGQNVYIKNELSSRVLIKKIFMILLISLTIHFLIKNFDKKPMNFDWQKNLK